jgi:hypothetical protein
MLKLANKNTKVIKKVFHMLKKLRRDKEDIFIYFKNQNLIFRDKNHNP